MNKLQLQEILSAPFDLDNWRDTLAQIFDVKHFHQQPQQIILPANDKAEAAYELGSFETQDDRLIGLYQVNVLPGVMLERNKVGLRGLLRNVYKYDVDGALIVFVQGDNWRFSYVSEIRTLDEKGYVTQSITNPKRYTYFFGPGESCRTAVERFQLLSDNGPIHLKDIQEAFSVEKISKQFFREYKEHYSKFVDYLVGSKYKITAFNNDEKAIRNFCKKLLGRIVFLYFLQKKGWLGVPLNGKWGEGDRAFLKNLFLGTGANQSFYAAALTTLFFDTLNTIRENDICELTVPDGRQVEGKPCRIPYLNGGLFEKESDKYDFLTFPPQLFTDLFAFFDSYNFTIYEDSPEEHTMAVDPEMLGHIFENLLEDNKDKGAYYTPKEIVHYMTQESLIEYLFTHCRNSDSADYLMDSDLVMERIDIENLIKNKDADNISSKQAEHLVELLDTVKICDPAIGSGAFPMGLLHEIYSAKQVLHACHSERSEESHDWNPAKVKENIIQNSIYGVDIEKGAVDIARLRFWLSLIVDEETPRPLPNLEYKIVVGNSLVPKFEDEVIEIDWDLKYSVGKADEYVQKIQALLKQIVSKQRNYFNPGGDKQKQKQEIRDLKIELLITQLTLNKYRYQAKNPLTSNMYPTAKDRQKDLEIKTILAGFDRNIAKLKALQGNDKPFEHFDWKLDFPDVMNENVAKEVGFDLVIGNPPYVDSETMTKNDPEYRELLRNKFIAAEGNWDLFVVFTEKAILLSKVKDGVFTFIIPNKLIGAKYTNRLREYILKFSLLEVRDYSRLNVFKEADVYPVTLLLKKNSSNKINVNMAVMYDLDTKLIDNKIDTHLFYSDIYWDRYFFDGLVVQLLSKLSTYSKIGDYFKKIFGAATVNEAYKIKKYIIDSEDINSSKKLINTGTIDKYISLWGKKKTQYIKAAYQHPIISDKNLKNISNNRFNQALSNKVIIAGMSKEIEAFYDEGGYLAGKSTTIIQGNKIDNLTLTAILNSKLINFYVNHFYHSLKMAGGFININTDIIKNIPVYPNFMPSEILNNLVIDIISKIDSSNVDMFINNIDLIIYKLYQLTYDEVLVVDPAFPLSKKEYENYEIE